MRAFRICVFVAAFLVWGAAASRADPLTLSSGKSVEILAIEPLPASAGAPGLQLTYRTLTPLADTAHLRQEVDEIWNRFVAEADRGGSQTAIISATGPTGAGAIPAKAANFAFDKRDGVWRTHESNGRAKLDAPFIREFMARLDWAYDHNDMNAFLLYLATDWSVTITNPHDSAGTQTIDRLNFAALTGGTLAKIKNFQHGRDILDIVIDDGGTTARVQSRETEHSTINDRDILIVERSTDLLELRGDTMLIKKSASVVETQTEGRRD